MGSRQRRYWLGLIVLVGLVFRLALWLRVPMHEPGNDEVEYLQVARDLVAGRGWVFYEQYHWLRAPLYPLFLAGSLLLAGGELRWAALPNIALSTAMIPLFYLLTRAVVRRAEDDAADKSARAERAGLIAAGLVALHMPLATFASLWMSETLFTALFVGALLLLMRWDRQRKLWMAAAGGVLLGLAILTRSAPLAGLPLLLGWMAWPRQGPGSWRHGLASGALLVAVTTATIAPWTIRNWIAYGGFIPVETGLSYNLWAFNEPREGKGQIFRTLEAIPNPVERSAFATRKGLERLREDPTILLRRIPINWFYIWSVFPVEDRFLQANYKDDVPIGGFTLALVLDDALYLLILGAACAGLVVAPWDRSKLLLAGWAVYAVATFLLTHSEGRYRQFLLPTLVPYAAGMLAGTWWGGTSRRWRALAAAAGLLGLLPLASYPYQWAGTGLRRGWAQAAGDSHMARGNYGAAQAAYRRAIDIDPRTVEGWLKLGQAYDRSGQIEEAITAYGQAAQRELTYIPANALLGDALRRAGALDDARAAFTTEDADPLATGDWAWTHLTSRPPSTVDVGGGLDIGFVGGVYAPEESNGRSVRWTKERAGMRLAGSAEGAVISITLAAPRPDGRTVIAQICASGRCQPIEASGQWRTYTLLALPCAATTCDPTLEVELLSPTFVPGKAKQDTSNEGDTREVGLLVDAASSAPLADRTAAERARMP